MSLALLRRRDRILWWALAHVPGAAGIVRVCRGIWHSICDRLAEWMLTAWMLNWGITLAKGGTFASPAYRVMETWATIESWSLFCLIGGLGRLILLVINGAWRKSPHFRILAALGSIPLWAAVGTGFQMSGTNSTGTGAYFACILAELVSMYRATREAGWNDGRAAHQGNIG